MSLAEAQARISAREFAEWMAYYTLEPWGQERADLRAGIIASTVANANRDAKKRRQPFKPQDFMPAFDREPQTADQQLAMARMITEALGGEILTAEGAESAEGFDV